MAVNRMDGSKPAPEAKAEAEKKGPAEVPAAGSAPAASGGIKPWLPLIINVLMMPALAYGVTTFVIAPKLGGAATKSEAPKAESKEHGGGKKTEEGHGGGPRETAGRTKHTAPLPGKVLVNVAGTMGTRYLLANITLVSSSSEIKGAVERNDAELRDAAASTLSGKTIQDLEKPGARNLVRTELISVFNGILGGGIVNEIYLTEFAIQ
jgi:flagellar FliL protein